ncbi:polysaccharide deacetylase family protein [Flavihumibacter rivuli]|uniref:polysaccharide deacetylase family protein n=1 Tax=Flavihumibacter rivuli TaxID=2838156 RepID=UPI001BDE0A90|nr:polysaccharide deacetylase family protein [Flavihumibacter rivuli]ULQ57945.1 polysaccharide deacetylase family protein [Flavihumibacter rivuli]
MRAFIKRIIKETIGLALISLHYLKGNRKDNILSITLHNPSVQLMAKVVKWLRRRGYRIISLAEFDALLQKGKTEERIALVTLDDGWKSNLDLLPLLEDEQVPLAIFVPTEPVVSGNYWWEYAGRKGQEAITGIEGVQAFKKIPNTIFKEKISLLKQQYELNRSCVDLQQLGMLARNKWITIGSHTVNHPLLDQCIETEQEFELKESKRQLEEWLGRPVTYIAYPNGNLDNATIKLAGQCGYRLGFTTYAGKVELDKVNRLLIPRYTLNEQSGDMENLAKMLGLWQRYFKEKDQKIKVTDPRAQLNSFF